MNEFSKRGLLVLALTALSLTGCGKQPDNSNTPSVPTSESTGGDTAGESAAESVGGESASDSTSEEQAPVLANGLFSYSYFDYAEKEAIMGALEKYAVENYLTGLTLYESGGYVLYQDRITKGTNTYIPGYGFGVLSEGTITAPLAGESNTAWKNYYHTFETEDPAHINYMNDKGSVVGDLISYHSEGYWDIKMNEEKDGYVWYNALAKEKPQAVNEDEHGQATKWKFHVKTGEDGFVYNTTSKVNGKYAGQGVALEDYVTPYKLYYTAANAYARGAENLSGSGSIKGSKEYYEASKNGFAQAAWDNIGIKTGTDDEGAYLEFEFNVATTPFYAMYYLASGMFTPVPQGFIDEIGGPAKWGCFVEDGGLTPVDTTLSTGPYMLENWQNGKQIVFKKNDKWHDKDSGRYSIEGVHINILEAYNTDPEAALKEFEANKLDSCGVPSDKLDQYKSDPRATKTKTGSTFKLNYNTCTQERWEELFGMDGTIAQTSVNDYWECEPAMSNDNFLKGLSYSFNRTEYVDNLGSNPSLDWLGSSYLSDPEEGVSYGSTQAHKDAIASLTAGAEETSGYNLEIARAYFKAAAEEMLASGAYKEGDKITLEIGWMYESQFENYGDPLIKYFQDAFNDPSVCGGKLTLEVTNWAGAEWSDVYYNKMMVGQFDLCFGSISGNSLNPLNFFEVLRSDNSSGFTLNWGADTNSVDNTIVYDGKIWSFDALWQAADTAAYVENGQLVATYGADFVEETPVVVNEDGTVTMTFDTKLVNIEGVSTEIAAVVIWNNEYTSGADYFEDEIEAYVVNDDGTVTVTVSADLWEAYSGMEYVSLDVYFNCVIGGIESAPLVSIYAENPAYVEADGE